MVPAVRIDFYDADELKVKKDKYKCYSYNSVFTSSPFYSSLWIGGLLSLAKTNSNPHDCNPSNA